MEIYSEYGYKQVESFGLPVMRDPKTQEQRDAEKTANTLTYPEAKQLLGLDDEQFELARKKYGLDMFSAMIREATRDWGRPVPSLWSRSRLLAWRDEFKAFAKKVK